VDEPSAAHYVVADGAIHTSDGPGVNGGLPPVPDRVMDPAVGPLSGTAVTRYFAHEYASSLRDDTGTFVVPWQSAIVAANGGGRPKPICSLRRAKLCSGPRSGMVTEP
jgi:hypothetical protein